MTCPPPADDASTPAADPADEIEIRIPLPDLIAGLAKPEAFGVDGPVDVVQTHVSAVFLAGDRAYKVKKPIRLWGFLDYGTVDVRRSWCETEVRLNRRLAPEIYEGVVPVVRRADGSLHVHEDDVTEDGVNEDGPTEDGEVVEHAVVMIRLAPGATFLEQLEAGTLGAGDLRESAAVLAAFHAANRLAPEDADLARPDSFFEVVNQNFLSTEEGVPDLFPASVHEGLHRRIADRTERSRALVDRRASDGLMVNGHGDVRLEHVIRYDGQVNVIDCVEFSDLVRHIDPLCDMAFLSMDLAERGRWGLARGLEEAYLESSNESREEAALLLPLYRSYRAHVRAKVDHLTARSPEVDADVRAAKLLGARRFLALAWTYARADETPPLIVMRGASGTGKSVLASVLAPWLGAEVVRSDVVRKELAGLAPTDRLDDAGNEKLYAHDMSQRTYDTLLERAETFVRGGRAVVLDATYLRKDSRDAARALADRLGAPFAILDVGCDPDVVRGRLRRRETAGTDASDAGIAVYEEQLRETDPIGSDEEPFVVRLVSGEAPELAVMRLLEVLEAGSGGAR